MKTNLTYSLVKMEDAGKDNNILSQLVKLTNVGSKESNNSCMDSFLVKLKANKLKKSILNKSTAILVREKGSKDIIAWCLMTTIKEKERRQVFFSPEAGETEEITWFYGRNYYTNAKLTGKTRNTQCTQFFVLPRYRRMGIGKELARRSTKIADQYKRTYAVQGWDSVSHSFLKNSVNKGIKSMYAFIGEIMDNE